jgi:hypothetical protein
MDSTTNIQQLFELWDSAIAVWQADRSGTMRSEAAATAMGWGAYFEALYEDDPLLEEIHYNFGLLETPGTDDDPDNQKLWLTQEKLIGQARQKYHVASTRLRSQ